MKKIIILERQNEPSDNTFRVVFWAVVPVTRQLAYANSSFNSQYKDAIAQEISDLRTGVVVESVETFMYPAGTTQLVMTTDLINKYNIYQNFINTRNTYSKYGTSWDGTSWTTAGLA